MAMEEAAEDEANAALAAAAAAEEAGIDVVAPQKRQFNDLLAAVAFAANGGALFWLTITAMVFGRPMLLAEEKDKADWFGQGLIQVVEEAQTLFVLLPIQTVAVGAAWWILLRAQPLVFPHFSLICAVVCSASGSAYLWQHAVAFEHTLLHFCALVLTIVTIWFGVSSWRNRRKLELTAGFIIEGSSAFDSAIYSIGVSILCLFLLFWLFWVITAINLCSFPAGGKNVEWEPRVMIAPLLIGGLWVSSFLQALLRTVMSGAVASWYFSRSQTPPPSAESGKIHLVRHFFNAVSYSFGSIALGSAIVQPLEIAQSISTYLERTPEGAEVATYACNACSILHLAPYLNRFAYVRVAVHGTTLIRSAKDVFRLFGRNPVSTLVTHDFKHIVPLSIVVMSVGFNVLLIGYAVKDDGLPLHLVTLLLAVLLSIGISSFFASLVTVAAESVIVCYCEDIERARDSSQSSVFISPELHAAVQAKLIEGGQEAAAHHDRVRCLAQHVTGTAEEL